MRIVSTAGPYAVRHLGSGTDYQTYLSGMPLGYLDGITPVDHSSMLNALSAGRHREISEIVPRSFGSWAWIRQANDAIEVVISPSHPGVYFHYASDSTVWLGDDLATLAKGLDVVPKVDTLEALRYIPGVINGGCFKTVFAGITRIPGNVTAIISSDGRFDVTPVPPSGKSGLELHELFDTFFDLLSAQYGDVCVYSSGGIDSGATLCRSKKSTSNIYVVNGDESNYRKEVAAQVFATIRSDSRNFFAIGSSNDSEYPDGNGARLAGLDQSLIRERFGVLVKTNYFRTNYKIRTADLHVARSTYDFKVRINGYGADELLLGEKTGPELSSIYSYSRGFNLHNLLHSSPFSLPKLLAQYVMISRHAGDHRRDSERFTQHVAEFVCDKFAFFGKTAESAGWGMYRRELEGYLGNQSRDLALWIARSWLSRESWSIRVYIGSVRQFIYFQVTHLHVLRYSGHGYVQGAIYEFPYLQGAVLNEMATSLPPPSNSWRPKRTLYRIYRDTIGEPYARSLRRARCLVGVDQGVRYRFNRTFRRFSSRALATFPRFRRLAKSVEGFVSISSRSGRSEELQLRRDGSLAGIHPALALAYSSLNGNAPPLADQIYSHESPHRIFSILDRAIEVDSEGFTRIVGNIDLKEREVLNWMHINVFLDHILSDGG